MKGFWTGFRQGLTGVQQNGGGNRGGTNRGYGMREFGIGAGVTALVLGIFELGRRYGKEQAISKDESVEIKRETHQKAKEENKTEVQAADGTKSKTTSSQSA